jgi:NAD(P)H-hydrate epimerase
LPVFARDFRKKEEQKRSCFLFLLAPGAALSADTKINFEILKKLTKRVWLIEAESGLKKIDFSSYALLIDAIFGIGLKGKVEGIFKKAIQEMNSSRRIIVSIDIPSGLDANKGRALGVAVKANYTISLIAPKKGLFLDGGKEYSGRIITRHIGFHLVRI